MLVLKYEKLYPSIMSSHIDTLRVINRIFRRAKIDVACSGGFNPHMLLFFSPALSVGIESVSEFVSAETEATDTIDRLNAVCPEGIRFSGEFSVAKNPNLAGSIRWAEYEFRGVDSVPFLTLECRPQIIVSYKNKGEMTVKDIKADIKRVFVENGVLRAVISCGNVNLRADRFIEGCAALFGIPCDAKIKKLRMFNGEMQTAEQIISALRIV